MSSWIYRKPEPAHVRGLCILCNKYLQKKTSSGKYQALCCGCDDKRYRPNRKTVKTRLYSYKQYKQLYCECCGFIAEHRCQLDIHHIDRNHHNNDPDNLITLCANCHRLEHQRIENKTKPRRGISGVLSLRSASSFILVQCVSSSPKSRTPEESSRHPSDRESQLHRGQASTSR